MKHCLRGWNKELLVGLCLIQLFTGSGQKPLKVASVGEVIDSVSCLSSPDQTYALFLPSTYTTNTTWPVLFIFEPGARGKLGAEVFRQGAEKFGYILLCSNNSSNRSLKGSYLAAEAMFRDAVKHYNVDTTRIFVTGFSGGARFASELAIRHCQVKGVIACGAGMSRDNEAVQAFRKPSLYYGIIGNRDLNLQDMNQTEEMLTGLNIQNHVQYIEGDHHWPSELETTLALAWLRFMTEANDVSSKDYYVAFQVESIYEMVRQELLVEAVIRLESLLDEFPGLDLTGYLNELRGRRAFDKQKSQRKRAFQWEREKQLEYMGALTTFVYVTPIRPDTIHTSQWWKREIRILQKWEDSKNHELSQAASRLLYTLEVHFAEDIEVYINERQLTKASYISELWLDISPNKIWTLWNTLRVYALLENREIALELITRIVNSGEATLSWFEGVNEFDFLRLDPGFSALIKGLEH